MKNISFILLLMLCCFFRAIAQPPRHRDTTRIGFSAARAEAIDAPVLRGNGQGMTIVPNRQQFCFDLEMDVELNFGGRISRDAAVFINTTDGYVGYTIPSAGGPITELIPEIESFRFNIVSFKLGNAYSYFNRKGNNGIEHLVSTMNSDAYENRINGLLTTAPLLRKSDYRTYCDGKARALAYKRDGSPTVWYVYGDRFPASLTVQKFLGEFGVGVARTDAGTFMVMELNMGSNHTLIKHIERRHVCFDPSGFKMQEADFFSKQAVNLQQREQKINDDEEKAQHAPCCVTEHMAEIAYSRQQLRIQQQNLQRSQQGNLAQDAGAQRAFFSMSDPSISVHAEILSTQTAICTARFYAARDHTTASAKVDCLGRKLSAYQAMESQMQAIDRRYTNIVQAMTEKSRLFTSATSQIACN